MAYYHIISSPEQKKGVISVDSRKKAVKPQDYGFTYLEVLNDAEYISAENIYWYIMRMYAGYSFGFIELE